MAGWALALVAAVHVAFRVYLNERNRKRYDALRSVFKMADSHGNIDHEGWGRVCALVEFGLTVPQRVGFVVGWTAVVLLVLSVLQMLGLWGVVR